MNKQNHDLIGNAFGWGPGWGGPYGGPAQTAFGLLLDESVQQGAAPQGMNPYAQGCGYGAPPYLDPNLMNAMIAKQHSVLVGQDFGPQEVEQIFGFKSQDALEPGETREYEATPEIVSKLCRLFIPTSVASQILVVDLTIGIKSQFPGKGVIPGLVFSELSTNNRVNGDTCYIRQPIVLSVKNISSADVEFAAAVGVVAVQGGGPRIIGPGSGHM